MALHRVLSSDSVDPPTRRRPSMRRTAGALMATGLLGILAVMAIAPAHAAPVGLGTAGSFAVLAGSGITNTGPTTITGDVGTFPTTSQTGFSSVTLNGTNHAGDAVTQGAKDDLVTAYNDAAGRGPATSVPVELGGTTKLPGVYTSPTFGLTGTLTLDGLGDPNSEFVFQAGSTLITASNSTVLFINGANPCNVVWQVGSSATFGTGTAFVGTVLAYVSITAQTGATFEGRLLARDGAVTLDTNTITSSVCASAGPTTTTTGGGGGTATTTAPGSTSGSPEGSASGATPDASAPGSGVGLTGATVPSTGRPALPFTGSNPWIALTGALVLTAGVLLSGISRFGVERRSPRGA